MTSNANNAAVAVKFSTRTVKGGKIISVLKDGEQVGEIQVGPCYAFVSKKNANPGGKVPVFTSIDNNRNHQTAEQAKLAAAWFFAAN